jgi:hypothetical protein
VDVNAKRRKRRSKVELAIAALCRGVIDTRQLQALSPEERKLVLKKVAEHEREIEVRILARYYPFGLKS